jgi:MFS family permease
METVRLASLFALLYFLQGIGDPVAGLIAQPVRSILKSWGESPATMSAFAAAASLPWTLKPLYGLLSDFVPFFGYRRKSYLLATAALAAAGFLVLYQFRPEPGNYVWFLVLLLAPTIGIAFGDVLVDALMIERGQPRGLTGRLQSVQWAASYTATLLAGALGGFLAHRAFEYEGFLVCGVLALLMVALTWRFVHEERHRPRELARPTAEALRRAARSPALLGVVAFLFLWGLDPVSNTVVYVHTTETMGLSEQLYGYTQSALGAGCILASVAYALYCRRVSMLALAHASILLGAASHALYWTVSGPRSALAVHVLVGFTWMTATLIQLDLAARVCPPAAAATVFATIMAATNLASSLGEWWGGGWYDALLRRAGGVAAFELIVALGVAIKLSCWLLFALHGRWSLTRRLKDLELAAPVAA